MNLYLLKRVDEHVHCDEAAGFVIAAESPEDARSLAITKKGDEDVLCWVQCEPAVLATNVDVPRGIVLSDYRNG